MAVGRSLLKWGAVLLIAALIPQTIPALCLYFAWRLGLITRAKRLAVPLGRWLLAQKGASRWRFAGRGDLRELVTSQRFYIHDMDAPFVFVPSLLGLRCVSALILEGGACSPELYKKAAGEALRLLSHDSRLIVVLSGGGEEGDKVYVVSKARAARGDFMRSGTEMVERLRIAAGMMESVSPSLRVRICRGEEITAPLLGGN